MPLVQLVGVAFVTALAAILLKQTKPELSLVVSVAGGVILLLFSVDYVKEAFSFFQELTQLTGVDSELFKILFKMLGIGYLLEFSCDILVDFGQNSLADRLALCGKIFLLLLSIPVLKDVLTLMKDLIGYVS